MGINGYQYISNDYHCMVCDTPDTCSNCDDIRVLPWVQDVPAVFNLNYTNQSECEENGLNWDVGEQIVHDELDESNCAGNGYVWFHGECIEYIYGCVDELDVWGNWNAILRDLVIVNKQGYEVSRLNLTYNNPDPLSTCGENYETIKQLIIDAR